MDAPNRQNLLVVLDLDETLVFGTEAPLDHPPDFVATVYSVYKRPHVDAFLHALLERYDVAVWTASSRAYCDVVVDELFGERRSELSFVWSGEKCVPRRGMETHDWFERKPLKKVKRLGFDLRRVVAIDNTPTTFDANYGNGIAVRDYEGSRDDDELLVLLAYLEGLDAEPDVRRVEKRGWRRRADV